jgi:hypothetical protein
MVLGSPGELFTAAAYRIACEPGAACIVKVATQSAATGIETWYQQALSNPVAATQNITLVVYDNAAVPQLQFDIHNAVPTGILRYSATTELTLQATQVTGTP